MQKKLFSSYACGNAKEALLVLCAKHSDKPLKHESCSAKASTIHKSYLHRAKGSRTSFF